VGGVAAVYLAGGILDVDTLFGFVTLFGITTRNGIMMVSQLTKSSIVERKCAFVHEGPPQLDVERRIDLENHDRGSADRRTAAEEGTIPTKMPPPPMAARVKQRDQLAGLFVSARDIGAFSLVACQARPGAIGKRRRATMGFGDDMIQLKGHPYCRLRHVAVFAPSTGAAPHSCLERLGHGVSVSQSACEGIAAPSTA
jgi:hypothetical protein